MLFKFFILAAVHVLICNSSLLYEFDIKGNALHGYYISSFIGTPPQRINLLIDTGSSNLAVTVVHQKNMDSRYFVYNQSLTFRPTNTEVKLRYIQGYWTGFIGLDIFNPCLKEDCTIVCNISCMSSMKDIFDSNSKYHGIIGLAYSSIALPSSSVRPFLDVFLEEKNISNIFSLYLCGPYFNSKEHSSSCGKIHVGYLNQDCIAGDIMYTPIVHQWFYEITVIGMKVAENTFPFTCEELNKNKSIIDSGTTNLNFPLSIYSWVILMIKKHVASSTPNNFWINETVVCVKNNSLNVSLFPLLTLSLYHSHNTYFNIHISPELYMLQILNASCAMLAVGVSDYGVMIGSAVMRGFYVIFDRENKRIGFAKPKFQDMRFISEVSSLEIHSDNFDHCIRKEVVVDSDFPTALGLVLTCLIFVSFCVLLPLLTWLWKLHIKKVKMDRSDIINLVDDE